MWVGCRNALGAVYYVETNSGSAAIPPAVTALPVMADLMAGDTLSHTAGSYSGTPAPTIAATYRVNGVVQPASYVAQSEDVVTVTEVASNAGGTVTATSAAVTVPVLAPVTRASITAIAADGWRATDTNPITYAPEVAPDYVVATRQGFDATGAATTVTEPIVITQRVREPFPNQATLSAGDVSLSEPVFAGDQISGVTNGSTLAAPKPVCVFSRPDRALVGSTIDIAICAFSAYPRNGEPCAAVVFEASDGVTTVSQTVTALTVSTWGATDHGGSVLEYQATLDIAGLSDGLITVNARAYPHIGSAYADSSRNLGHSGAEGNNRHWHPRYYVKASGHTPIYAYVSTTGDDGAGLADTTPATAQAAPFATIAAAANAIKALDGINCEGHEIRLMAGTHAEWGTAATDSLANTAHMTITRDPSATRANVILQSSSATTMLDADYIKIEGVTLQRTLGNSFTVPVGNASRNNAAHAEVWVQDCVVDNLGDLGTTRFFSLNFYALWSQNTITNPGELMHSDQAAIYHWHRGNHFDAVPGQFHFATALGNFVADAKQIPGALFDVMQEDGFVFAFNRFDRCSLPVLTCTQQVSYGAAIVQNLFEHTGLDRCIQWAAESAASTATQDNLIVHHNTVAAQGSLGRVNMCYDDDPGTLHAFSNVSVRANDFGQLNIKTDVFSATQNGANTGNWALRYGSGCGGNVTESTLEFNQEYPGLGCSIPSGSNARQTRFYVDYQSGLWDGTIYSPGLGGGDYRLTPSDPGYRLAPRALPFDLLGNPRSEQTDAGCYQA